MFFGVLFGSNANFAKQQPIFGKEKRESDSLLRLTNKALNLFFDTICVFWYWKEQKQIVCDQMAQTTFLCK